MAQWHPLPQYLYALVVEKPNSVLLQTSRFDAANQTSYLFLDPIETLTACNLEQLPALFHQIEAALAEGHHLAGYLNYECGYHFEPSTNISAVAIKPEDQPLAWFGVYKEPITFDHAAGTFSSQQPATHTPLNANEPFAKRLTFDIGEDTYRRRILQIKDLITAGDTYQVNFTGQISLETSLSPAQAFATLTRQQPVAYSAFLNVGGQTILSLSPELFFHLEAGKITTRPMKGTTPRGLDLEEDTVVAQHLQLDEKNRSEHVMIVDLLRNDLGRICTMGSVQVEDLFTVERYETLHQMTSTVIGNLRPNLTFYEIFRALFPCGSITGAPKVRTMQIIRDLEAHPRGLYTGAIGHIASNRNATFNVAIRTLTLANGHAEMGVGGGIVADSEPASEYRECLLKAAFLTRTPTDFQLIETILWDSTVRSYFLLPLHLDRLAASSAYFNFLCDRDHIHTQLEDLAATFADGANYRIRLLLHPDGQTTITPTAFHPTKPTGRIRLSTECTSSTDLFLRHKTTRRSLYDEQYRQAIADGFDEVIFRNERGEVTEGAISNLFLRFGDKLFTPPLSAGVLPGIYRRHLLQTDSNAEEKVLTFEDLQSADAIYICNSIRGMNEVKLIPAREPA